MSDKDTINKIKKMKPSAYRSMLLGKYGLTNSTPQKKKDLLRWGSPTKGEKWLNLTPYGEGLVKSIKDSPACGSRHEKQKGKSVCRPLIKINKKTPEIATTYTKAQIKKAIEIKNKGNTINWKKL